MSLFTSNSAVTVPMLSRIDVDPAILKRVSRIDRLGNLTPRNITVSPFLTHLAEHLGTYLRGTSTRSTNAIDQPSSLSKETQWELSSLIRDAVMRRQQLLIGLVPVDTVELLQSFFGIDTIKQHHFAVRKAHAQSLMEQNPLGPHPTGPHLLQPIGSPVTCEDIPFIRDYLEPAEPGSDAETTPNNSGDSNSIAAGQRFVPVAINPSDWCQTWCRGTKEQQKFMRKAFKGADSVSISSHNYAALKECNAGLIPSSRIYRALRSPKFWAYGVVFIYSSLRALPVMFVPRFHGSVLVLWSMDVLTAIPYTWGLLAFVTAHRRWVRYAGLVVTLVTFMAPYIYFWTHGRHYPPGVILVVIAMIVGAIAWETINYLRDVAVKNALQRTTDA